ncbi:autotransporter outer membrane beta-barrel domain-containing protein [Stutzerimonas xanthomarina]|nr:autotransporter outer membrane beta-barrel domain-containing protein [Stutzerimonas xanthomarina]
MLPSFRKTLLALAVTGAALPVYAQTVQLDNTGISNEAGNFESLEINGSFEGVGEAVVLNGTKVTNDLLLNANIKVTSPEASGIDFLVDGDGLSAPEIGGDLIQRGTVQVIGDGSVALIVDPATVGGSLINEGTLSVKGDQYDDGGENDNSRALHVMSSTINGDLKNDVTGKIIAEGEHATALSVGRDTTLGGQLINEGLIAASGESSTALSVEGRSINIDGYEIRNEEGATIRATGTDSVGVRLTDLDHFGGVLLNNGVIEAAGENARAIFVEGGYLFAIDSEGKIVATGEDSHGIVINETTFDGYNGVLDHPNDRHIRNSGLIQADDAAILIGSFEIDDRIDFTDNFTGEKRLGIENLGHIVSKDEAIDASLATGDVDLYWGIVDPNDDDIDDHNEVSTITGNLIGLSNIEIRQNALFTGTDVTVDGANIVMKNDGRVNVGSSSDSLSGNLELGLPHTIIDGNLYVAGNSSLTLNLSKETNEEQAVLSITKTAEFGDGAQIKLAAKGSDFRADGVTYTLVEAGSVEDEGLKVVSSSSLLNVDTYAVEGNRIVSKVTAKGTDQVAEVIEQSGANGNGQAAGSKFYSEVFQTLAVSGNDAVAQAFLAASANPEALKRLSEQLAPEINGSATQAALSGQSLVSGVAAGRTSGARGMSSGDGFQETGVWLQSLYSDANQDLRDGVAGYNAHSRGIALGADGKLNDQLTLGLAYSFLNTDVNSDGGNKTEVDGHAFTLYGGYELGNYFVDASLTYGVSDNSSKRHIASTTAKADYDSDLLGLNLMGGYSFQLDNGLLIEPRLAARYSNVKIDGYSEKGSSAALKTGAQRYEVAELGAGFRLASSFGVGRGTLEPQAKLMAYHDFAGDRASSTSTFVLGSTPFVTTGAKPVRNSYEAGVGADYRLGAVTLGVSYDYVGKTGFDADTVQAKLRYDF